MTIKAQRSFDYIIVGAGSAGCVLAARLTEERGIRVLLLEAGPRDQSWRIAMPAAVGSLLSSDRFNWNYVSDPEPGLDGRRLTHPRGRVLGGSSSINGMVYIRGHARDYDGWAAGGLTGWSYAEVLPYFKRAEGHLSSSDSYHGNTGPLTVFAPALNAMPLATAFVEAALESGYGFSNDVNGERQEGFGRIDRTTTRHGRRASVARTYLRPALSRPNLTVETHALARRVILDRGRAIGVEYSTGSDVTQAFADAEVIVAAGAINSPQLLQLSGLGKASDLGDAGIAVSGDLPAVGRYLSDHPDIVIQHSCVEPVSIYPANRGLGKVMAGVKWFAGLESLANSNHFEAGGFIRSRAGIEHPDLQLTFMPLAIQPGTVDDVGMHSFQVHIDLMRPKSMGRVTIRSCDPMEAPSICFNYLTDAQDVLDLRASVRLTREILRQPALTRYRGEELNPGESVQDDAQIDAWVQRNVETCYHPVGTCRMGTDPQDSVVDAECRVHGVANLRVVDASVMPAIISGNTNAPTIMIAEKLSDLIRGKTPLPFEAARVWRHPNWAAAQR